MNFMEAKKPKSPKAEAPAKKQRGALMVHEKLREDIQWLRIDPGSALDEVALAKTYAVSRTPIREALLLLANEGFVQFLQNRTTIVAPLSLHNQAAFLDTFILLSRGLVRAAALNGGAERGPLDACVAQYADGLAGNDSEAAFRAQLALYRDLAGRARNRFLAKYFLEAQDASVRMKLLYYYPHLAGPDRDMAVNRLRAVVDAVTSGLADAADDAVRDAILGESAVIQRGLGPRYAHQMDLTQGDGQ